jgi:hypothetical protein
MRCLVLLCVCGLAGCALSAELHPIVASIYPHRDQTTASFRVPAGWTLEPNEENSSGWIVVPKQGAGERSPAIILDYYHYFDTTRRIDQQEQAESELDEVHDHSDESVVMDVADEFDAGTHGRLRIYRYRSDYWGDRRFVFVVTDTRVAQVQLYARTTSEADACQKQLEDIARSIRFSRP